MHQTSRAFFIRPDLQHAQELDKAARARMLEQDRDIKAAFTARGVKVVEAASN